MSNFIKRLLRLFCILTGAIILPLGIFILAHDMPSWENNKSLFFIVTQFIFFLGLQIILFAIASKLKYGCSYNMARGMLSVIAKGVSIYLIIAICIGVILLIGNLFNK